MRAHKALVALALMCAGSAAGAQPLLLGARAGGTSATQVVNYPFVRYDARAGVVGGLAGTLEFGRWFALQGEALYAEKGARLDHDYEMQVDYLELPLVARLSVPVGRGIRPFVSGGVAPAVEVRCGGYTTAVYRLDLARSYFVPGTSGRVALNCNDQRLRYADRGRVLGGGLLLDLGPRQFTLEFREVRGQDISGYGCCQLRNRTASVLVGVSRRMR